MTCETELVAAVEASLGVGPRKWFSRGFHIVHLSFLVGGFNHLEKYESQWEGLSNILWKIKNV